MPKINSSPVPGEPLLSIEQLADIWGVKLALVRALVQERRIASCKVGRLVRIHPSDAAAYLAEGKRDVWPS